MYDQKQEFESNSYCTEEGASFMTKQELVERKNPYLFPLYGHVSKVNWEYLESFVWICAYANDLAQEVIWWAVWLLYS